MEEKKVSEITINREWVTKFCYIVDKLNDAIALEDSLDTFGWLSHLNGYVHSMDEHFNKTK